MRPDAGAAEPYLNPPAFGLVNCIAQVDLAELSEVLDQHGFTVIGLDGKLVRDEATLLAQAETDLPAVAGMRPDSWDALADYLRSGIAELGVEQVAVVWTDADQIVGSDLQVLVDALRVLTGVADGARDGTGLPVPTTVLTFLVGDGPGFRRLAV